MFSGLQRDSNPWPLRKRRFYRRQKSSVLRILTTSRNQDQGSVSRKSRKRFGPEKTFITLRSAYSVKLVISYVVKGIKIIIPAKFRDSRRLRFEDRKTIMITSLEMRPKSFGILRNRPLISFSWSRKRTLGTRLEYRPSPANLVYEQAPMKPPSSAKCQCFKSL